MISLNGKSTAKNNRLNAIIDRKYVMDKCIM